MTALLTEAFKKASKLPEDIQDILAKEIIDEIEDEIRWDKSFGKSSPMLDSMVKEALDEYNAGKTKEGFDH